MSLFDTQYPWTYTYFPHLQKIECHFLVILNDFCTPRRLKTHFFFLHLVTLMLWITTSFCLHMYFWQKDVIKDFLQLHIKRFLGHRIWMLFYNCCFANHPFFDWFIMCYCPHTAVLYPRSALQFHFLRFIVSCDCKWMCWVTILWDWWSLLWGLDSFVIGSFASLSSYIYASRVNGWKALC